MNKKGQVVIGFIVAVIIAAISLSILFKFSQGTSGTLLVDNEAVNVNSNTTYYGLDFTPSGNPDCSCGNSSALTINTDFNSLGSQVKYWGNGTDRCDYNATNSANLVCDYSYYSNLYISNNGLTRTVASFIAVGFAIMLLIISFGVLRGR